MAGIFKTLGSTFDAVNTVAASGSRRLAIWAKEQETQTEYRHVTALTRIKTDCASELAVELKRHKQAIQDPDIADALKVLMSLDAAQQKQQQ